MPQPEIRISAKDLGSIAMPDFCPRCFWIKRNIKKLPFQIFPGIFYSIDSYTKKVIHTWLDKHEGPPPWLPEFKDVTEYLKVPHWSKFKRTDPETGLTVSGVADDLLKCADGTFIIPDYKTSKITETQDKLRPMYEGQLNSYAWIYEGFGEKVSMTPLVYCEPYTDDEAVTPSVYDDNGFLMQFRVQAVQIRRDPNLVQSLLKKAAKIIELVLAPEGVEGCKDCVAVDSLVELMKY